jgi:hypothetical protein
MNGCGCGDTDGTHFKFCMVSFLQRDRDDLSLVVES